jgi:hypothetical protein
MSYAPVAVRSRLSVMAVVLTGMLISAETAGACSCFPFRPEKQLKHADGAFNGWLLSVRPVEGTTEADFRYRIRRVFKGPFRRGKVVMIRSQNSDAVCGLPQATGVVYGLFVSRNERRWTSGACSVLSPRKMRRAAEGPDASGTPNQAACPAYRATASRPDFAARPGRPEVPGPAAHHNRTKAHS